MSETIAHPKKELEYKALSSVREHMLLRPDTYIGSSALERTCEWVCRNGKIQYEIVEYVPGFLRLFIEILSNAIDNKWRSDEAGIKCSAIKLTIDKNSGKTRIWNDGMTIPIILSNQKGYEKTYQPEMVFGHFWTSSNYNDTEERKTSGRNGYGSKVTNAFSKYFCVRTYDKVNKRRYTQTWRDNMTVVEPPIIEENVLDIPFTEVTWIPDMERLKSNYNPTFLAIIYRLMYDCSMITKLPVFINKQEIRLKTMIDYARQFNIEPISPDNKDIIMFTSVDSEVVLLPNVKNPFVLSFANGILTKKGGIHQRTWSKAIYEPLAAALSTKDKDITITADDVSKYFTLIISCFIDKPKFDSQAKDELNFPAPTASVKPGDIKKILKWEVINNINEIIEAKRLLKLKKLTSKKKGKPILKLDDANLAGPGTGTNCVLLFCEGDSAKTAALTGIQVGFDNKRGKDYFGILPIGGKILNVVNASLDDIAENEQIMNIIRAVGLQFGVDYTDDNEFKKLNYGTVMSYCDGDVDGLHIEGLILNLFNRLFPSLLKRKNPFITSIRSPIVRAFLKSGQVMNFYRSSTYDDWLKVNSALIKDHKYYKGLGTYNDRAVIDTFAKRRVFYHREEKCEESLLTAFSSAYSDKRKEWILKFRDNKFKDLSDGSISKTEILDMSFADFVNYDLILHSDENCTRMLPSIMDGFKESIRKIMFALFSEGKKYIGKQLKVSQLSGLVSQKTEYQHGEQCLVGAIIGLAQSFVGSSNLPMLEDDGQFGSRVEGGDDAAAGRYLFTSLLEITTDLFPSVDFDEKLITYKMDDKTQIEPEWYAPILPLILIRGCLAGIATGFSCVVPAYNPFDVIWLVKEWIARKGDILENREITITKRVQKGVRVLKDKSGIIISKGSSTVKEEKKAPVTSTEVASYVPPPSTITITKTIKVSKINSITPWYNGFKGTIERDQDKPSRYVTKGIMSENYHITELPIGVWTGPYLEQLKKMKAEGKIKNFKHNCTKAGIDITIIPKEKMSLADLGLVSHLHTSNMVCLDEHNKIRKYSCIEELVDNFCRVRLSVYDKRKALELNNLKLKVLYQENAVRFLKEVIADELKLYEIEGTKRKGRKRVELVKELEEKKYDKKEDTFNYLLTIHIDSLTDEKLLSHQKSLDKAKKDYEELLNTPLESIWLKEIAKFEKSYRLWLAKWQKNDDMLSKLAMK